MCDDLLNTVWYLHFDNLLLNWTIFQSFLYLIWLQKVYLQPSISHNLFVAGIVSAANILIIFRETQVMNRNARLECIMSSLDWIVYPSSLI